MRVHPWNRDVWRRLTRDPEHLPHALLLHGMAGVGKGELALAFAAWLLCEAPTPQGGCGRCRSCGWLAQGAHPDLYVVEPGEEESGTERSKRARQLITVQDVRQVIEALSLSAHQGGRRVVLIHPAEAMNAAAANALLKTLEEPPEGVILVLLSHQPRRLLPTVLSRCQRLAVPRPAPAEATAWLAGQGITDAEELLQEAGGSPLLALEYGSEERRMRRQLFLEALSDPAATDWCGLAQDLQGSLQEAWGWLLRWTCDLIACRAGVPARFFPRHAATLARRAAAADPARLWDLYQELLGAGRRLQHPLNAQLLLESWLLRYACVEAGRP